MSIRVIGYGDNVVDNYPEQSVYFPGGNALNFSVNASKLGADAYYIGEIGNDEEGRYIKEVLDKFSVNREFCFTSELSRTEKAQVELINNDRSFLPTIHGSRRAIQLSDYLLEHIFEQVDLVHSSCHSGVEEELQKWKCLKTLKSFDFSDPGKYRTNKYLSRIAPNIDIALFSSSNDSDGERKRLVNLCKAFGVSYVLFTRSEETTIFYDLIQNKVFFGKVSLSRKLIDTMGAGDAYFTAFWINLLSQEWRKGRIISENVIQEAFGFASGYAKSVVEMEGSFGFPKYYG